MKKFLIPAILLLLCLQQTAFAQMPEWSSVAIPGDSLAPNSLTFLDSLHGYLGVTKTTLINHNSSIWTIFYFETTDGGRSWRQQTDSNIVGPKDPSYGTATNQYNSPVLFASIENRYIYNPNHPLYSNGALIYSPDAGASWLVPFHSDYLDLYPLRTFQSGILLAYDKRQGLLYKSYDAGNKYSQFVDSLYRFTLYNIIKDSNYFGYGQVDSNWGGRLSFANSDLIHWTVAINRVSDFKILHPPTDPMGLQTLVSNDSGASWQTYNTLIPDEDTVSRIGGTLQYIKGTQYLYYFTGQLGEGIRDYGSQLTTADYGDPLFGINWLYSADYGKSWEFQYAYASRRRAFEAVRENEVWITARRANSQHTWDPASVIARTTDNGAMWEEDDKTLTNDRNDDGRIITFSDPRHGWIAARTGDSLLGGKITIYRYDANEQPANSVESQTEFIQKYLKIYPNPSWNQVRLQLGVPRTVQKVEFFDLMGRKQSPPYLLENNEVAVDVQNLPPATYIARVTYLYKGWTGDFTLPLVVQH